MYYSFCDVIITPLDVFWSSGPGPWLGVGGSVLLVCGWGQEAEFLSIQYHFAKPLIPPNSLPENYWLLIGVLGGEGAL